jgi:chromosome segregation ATPase
MKKRFYTIGSLICAGLLAVFGFGSCKSGKALQAERTRLTTQADSLTRRLSNLEGQLDYTMERIARLQADTHLAMYGGPNMTEEERREMMRVVGEKERAAREALKVEQANEQKLKSEITNTLAELNGIQGRLDQLK